MSDVPTIPLSAFRAMLAEAAGELRFAADAKVLTALGPGRYLRGTFSADPDGTACPVAASGLQRAVSGIEAAKAGAVFDIQSAIWLKEHDYPNSHLAREIEVVPD